MSRLAAVAKGLYYPTQLRAVEGIARLINIVEPDAPAPEDTDALKAQISRLGRSIRVLDPCAGRGSAAAFLTALLNRKIQEQAQEKAHQPNQNKWQRKTTTTTPETDAAAFCYAIELDRDKAAYAGQIIGNTINADALGEAWTSDEGFDVLFHNPPYDEGTEDKRLEHTFLKKYMGKLRPGGLLIHIVPQSRLKLSAEVLANNFEMIQVFRFPYPEFNYFNQVALLGVKSAKAAGSRRKIVSDAITALAEGKSQDDILPFKRLACQSAPIDAATANGVSITWAQGGDFLSSTIKAVGLGAILSYEEVRTEIQALRLAARNEYESSSVPASYFETYQINTRYNVPPGNSAYPKELHQRTFSDRRNYCGELMFRSTRFDPVEAIVECQEVGVWASNKSLRLDVLPDLNLSASSSTSTSSSSSKLNPLVTMKNGQMGLLVGIGMLDNMTLEDDEGNRAVVKGRTYKEFVVTDVKETEDGGTETKEKEVVRTTVNLIELSTGEIKLVPPEQMSAMVQRFAGSIKHLMMEKYPPVYKPVANEWRLARAKRENDPPLALETLDPEIASLERAITHVANDFDFVKDSGGWLGRLPLGGQYWAMVGAALSIRRNKVAWVVAEQGSGKSNIGTAAAHLSGANTVILICPSHLVEKWKREILATVPGAHADIIGPGNPEHGGSKGKGKSIERQLREAVERMRRTLARQGVQFDGRGNPIQNPNDFGAARAQSKTAPYFLIVSMVSVRTDGRWKPAVEWKYQYSREGIIVELPHCPRCGNIVTDKDGNPVGYSDLARNKLKCQAFGAPNPRDKKTGRKWSGKHQMWIADRCNEPLYTVDCSTSGERAFPSPVASKYRLDIRTSREQAHARMEKNADRKVAVAKLIARRYKGFFDLCILDEAHKFKGRDTAQGLAAGMIAETSRAVMCLTGTIAGGKSSNMYPLLWRFSRKIRDEFGIKEQQRFIEQYGVVERITYRGKGKGKDDDDQVTESGVASLRRSTNARTIITEKPGMSPRTLLLMLENTIFLKLHDVASNLPSYKEEVRLIDAAGDQLQSYNALEDTITSAMKEALAKGSQRFLGAYVNSLLKWIDQPFKDEIVKDPANGHVICSIPALPADREYPKEAELVELVHQELNAHRRVLVYVSDTDERNIHPRLEWLFRRNGIVSSELPSSVKAFERERWIEKKIDNGLQVLVVNPRLVETGLDLLAFQTIVFYQVEYSTYVMRQASRRSWRIGQTEAIKVVHFAYSNTMQTKAIRHMASKIRAAQMLEGEIETDELTALAEDESNELVYAIARAVVASRVPAIDAGAVVVVNDDFNNPDENAIVSDASENERDLNAMLETIENEERENDAMVIDVLPVVISEEREFIALDPEVLPGALVASAHRFGGVSQRVPAPSSIATFHAMGANPASVHRDTERDSHSAERDKPVQLSMF